MWKAGDEAKDACETAEAPFEIAYESLKMRLVGFRQVRRNANGDVFFAWKVKHDEKVVLYYVKDKGSKQWSKLLSGLKSAIVNYEFQDVERQLKHLYEQRHVLEKL